MKILLTTTSYQDCPGDHHALLESTGAEIIRERGPLPESRMLELAGDIDAFLCGDDEITQAVIDNLKSKGVDFLDWGHGSVDQAAVDLVHANGMELHVYTVNDSTRMQQLIDIGVDGITTDNPVLLRSLLP